MKNDKTQKILLPERIVRICFIICLHVLFAVPIVWVAVCYSVPADDDFSNAAGFLKSGSRLIEYVIKNVVFEWVNHQGTYSGCVFASTPVMLFGGIYGYRMECFFVSIIFFITLDILIYSISRYYLDNCYNKWCFSACLLAVYFGLFAIDRTGEIFYWHTGIAVYTVPIIFSFLAVSLFIRSQHNNCRMIDIILASIFAALGAGGSLIVTAFLCTLLTYFFLEQILLEGKIRRNIVIVIVAIVGALFNAIAPGNFARHSLHSNEAGYFSITKAIINTLKRVEYLLYNEKIGFALGISFIILFMMGRTSIVNVKEKCGNLELLFCFICASLSVCITGFPVALGYESSGFPERADFVLVLALAIFTLLFSYRLGQYSGGVKIRITQVIVHGVAFTIIIASVFCMLKNYTVLNSAPYRTMRGICKGDYKAFSDFELGVLNEIKESEKDVVTLYRSFEYNELGENVNLRKIGLCEDKDYYVNKSVSYYFEKKEVTLIIK